MQKITLLFGIFLGVFFISCEGPTGPPGYDGVNGKDGVDGSLFEAIAFEIKVDMNLNSDGVYEFGESLSDQGIKIAPADVLLIYRLEGKANGLDLWRQLPQPLFTDQGLLFYNFDFTKDNYVIYLEPEFNSNLVPRSLTDDQVFRILSVPADLGQSAKMDKSNMSNVMSTLGVTEKDVQRFTLN